MSDTKYSFIIMYFTITIYVAIGIKFTLWTIPILKDTILDCGPRF